MIRRFSSRQGRLDHVFLREKLRGARVYHRIAGYFRSSLLELIHEDLAEIDEVRIVCNSDLDPRDISAARTAEQQTMALREKWTERPPAAESVLGRDRYRRLYELLVRGNLQVRVVGRTNAPFVHGKAGYIEGRNGSQTAFIGSNNETSEGWKDHYELLWEDDAPEAATWVKEEFAYLWNQGIPLPHAIIEEIDRCARRLRDLTDAERDALRDVIAALEDRPVDPKFEAVLHYLREERWLDLGCIVFSQYYDTSRWIAEELAATLPGEPIALYAGADRSRILRDGRLVHVERDTIKRAVKLRELRLVIATDAACEGLNLQTLGTLINVDLPWNPSRLEQRIGRIKRFGQARESVDMLNLVYSGTRDEKVYERLSARMRDRFDVFGSLPDVIEDDWIEDIESLDDRISEFIERKKRANAFDIRYADTVDPKGEPWEKCANVLSRRDVVDRLSRGW
jgi:hypothetical protein